MAKNSAREVLGILRQFNIAGEITIPKEITHIKESSPRATTRIFQCIYVNTQYIIVIDNTVDDDTEVILELIRHVAPGIAGRFVRNPHETSFKTYGLRHKFREVYLFEVQPIKQRLDVELAQRYPDLSRSTIQKYIKAGYVSVRGKEVTRSNHEVSDADDIAVQPPAKTDFSARELPIVYIDDAVIVVNKPAGVLTHSKGAMNDEFTVADFFRRYTTDGLATNRPGIVHRLDRDTSGLIIGARDEETALLLKKQFAQRKVKKRYIAVTEGIPKVLEAVIDLPIGRNPSRPSQFRVDPSGKPAQTTYTVLFTNKDRSLVSLAPKTGRTHQLRVHLQYINTPILGDRVYGKGGKADRLYLHAQSLEITIPGGQRRIFEAPVPGEFLVQFQGVKNV